MSRKLQVIVGGQYGSEAKGAVAGYLAAEGTHHHHDLVAIRVAGPNAGHSVVDPKTGVKYALRQVPVAAVTNPKAKLIIAAGSEIDPIVLAAEVDRLEADGIDVHGRLFIDPMATLIQSHHIDQETNAALTERIGSTGKGIGAARAARIMRDAKVVRDDPSAVQHCGAISPTEHILSYKVDRSSVMVQIEGTQGYGLGLGHLNYPQVTSSNCRAIDFMAMAGVSPWEYDQTEIWVVYRPYPIRVAGNSGPLYEETTWEALGLEPEYTTVTKKMRRVGLWDENLARDAYRANGGSGYDRNGSVHVALTMADQVDPEVAGYTDRGLLLKSNKIVEMIDRVIDATGDNPEIVTTSDRTWVDLRTEHTQRTQF